MDERRFQIGIKGLVMENGKLLLLKSRYETGEQEVWDLPGGRIHKDDKTVFETLSRELAEEIPGISNVSILDLVDATIMPKSFPDGTGWMLIYYSVAAHLPNPITLTDEHHEYQWVSQQELTELFENKSQDIDFHPQMYEACLKAFEPEKQLVKQS